LVEKINRKERWSWTKWGEVISGEARKNERQE